jgi:hypothetical protein
MVTIDDAKQLAYSLDRQEHRRQIAQNEVLTGATEQCCEDFNSRVADRAEDMPKQGFNGF